MQIIRRNRRPLLLLCIALSFLACLVLVWHGDTVIKSAHPTPEKDASSAIYRITQIEKIIHYTAPPESEISISAIAVRRPVTSRIRSASLWFLLAILAFFSLYRPLRLLLLIRASWYGALCHIPILALSLGGHSPPLSLQ